MTENGRIGIGIIGAGNIAGHHIKGYLLEAKHAEVAAVADVEADRARRYTAQLGDFEVFSDYRDLIASPRVDAVDICLPHHLHKDAIVAAAAAGKHILCEKPLCLTLEEAEAVTSAVRAAGVTLMCAHNQLFLPAVAAARDMIRAGKLGKVYAARTTDVFALDVTAESIGWRKTRATSGGGELIDTGYHPNYLLLHLVDSVPVRVAAMLSRHRLSFLEGEDTAHVLVEFADGAIGSIVTGWAYEPAGSTERFSVVGEEGSLWSDGRVLFFKPRGGERVVVQDAGPSAPDTYALEVADFIACLREKRRPLNTEVEGVNVLKVILGAYASADRGMIVELQNL
ncbi:MAG TPA: Gfo/Idh/MocA family oxidoreductase [Candidatus Dormibacteraeota bacterium]|nr:Gfo/Idh/MocA family oxidoreductase [Candidatus Dormibacteraeota bacterium]